VHRVAGSAGRFAFLGPWWLEDLALESIGKNVAQGNLELLKGGFHPMHGQVMFVAFDAMQRRVRKSGLVAWAMPCDLFSMRTDARDTPPNDHLT
jgi:hypothetical protein